MKEEKKRRSKSKEEKPEKEMSWLDEENCESQDENSECAGRYAVEELSNVKVGRWSWQICWRGSNQWDNWLFSHSNEQLWASGHWTQHQLETRYGSKLSQLRTIAGIGSYTERNEMWL